MVEFSGKQQSHGRDPFLISGVEGEIVETIQSEVTISWDLTWLHHIKVVVKKASRRPDLLKHHLLNGELHQKELLGWGMDH